MIDQGVAIVAWIEGVNEGNNEAPTCAGLNTTVALVIAYGWSSSRHASLVLDSKVPVMIFQFKER